MLLTCIKPLFCLHHYISILIHLYHVIYSCLLQGIINSFWFSLKFSFIFSWSKWILFQLLYYFFYFISFLFIFFTIYFFLVFLPSFVFVCHYFIWLVLSIYFAALSNTHFLVFVFISLFFLILFLISALLSPNIFLGHLLWIVYFFFFLGSI